MILQLPACAVHLLPTSFPERVKNLMPTIRNRLANSLALPMLHVYPAVHVAETTEYRVLTPLESDILEAIQRIDPSRVLTFELKDVPL